MITRKNSSILMFTLPLFVCAIARSARAADLARLMPEETILYVEWSGSEAVRDARAGTAMGKLVAEPEMQRFGAELKKGFEALIRLAKQDESARPAVEAVLPILGVMSRKRVALNLIGVEMAAGGPSVSAVLAVEVGDEAEAFMKHIEMLRAMLPIPASPKAETLGGSNFQRLDIAPLPPIRYGVIDGVFLLAIGGDMVDRVLAVKAGSAPNLTKNEALAAALRRLDVKPAATLLTFHLDPVRLQAQGRALFTALSGAQDFPPPVPVLLEELGLNSMTSFTYTAQFKNGGYSHAALLATRGPSKGLLKLFDGKALEDEDFHAVARDATFAQVGNFALQEAFDEALRIVRQLGGPPLESVTQALERFETKTHMKLREDVIGLFDDGWAFFDAPSHGGLWFAGFTMVVEAKNASAFLEMMDKWFALIREAVGDENLIKRSSQLGAHTVHYALITAGPIPVSPAWGAHGDRVAIALFPQMVQQTLERMAAPDAKDRSILANPDFTRGRKLLPDKCSWITYTDTRLGVSDLYTFALPAATAAASYAGSKGVPIDPAAFPTHQTIVRHLFGDVGAISRIEEGILMIGHGPLPMGIPATIAGQQNLATSAMLISILLPSLSRARELSKRVVSSSNLSVIGKGCHIYANDHGDQFPPSLEALIEAKLCDAKALISPRDYSPDGCSYEYFKGQTTGSDPRNVLAYEPDSGEGGNILFVDGHVEWVKPPRFQQLLDETQARLVR